MVALLLSPFVHCCFRLFWRHRCQPLQLAAACGSMLICQSYCNHFLDEGSLEVKLPTIWTDGKAKVGRVREEKKKEERKSEKRKGQRKEDAGARKGRKVAKHCVGSGRSKSRLAKAAGAEPSGEMRDEKLHAVVARITFGSQNVQNTPGSDVGALLEVEVSQNSFVLDVVKVKIEKSRRIAAFLMLPS